MTEWVPVFASAQVRAAEQPELAAGHPLMLWAARALAMVVADELVDPGVSARESRPSFPGQGGAPLVGRILVLAGKGDNGGDALFAAAALLQWMPQRAASADPPADDLSIDVLCTAGEAHAQGLATALAAGARRVDLLQVVAGVQDYDLVLDGILGIGTTDPALRGGARDAVTALLPHVRAGRPRVIAVDLPFSEPPLTSAPVAYALAGRPS
jgi:NAD(P)H-hydrate repair Nnr-like enzyme with NAD(P)H-hydrate epimerase domain